MSLKVLLADDSAAIKKVVQLSLQDFGVELKSISSGKDVMEVAKSFQPDIAFIDVLLPHKTGYEIAKEMKKDAKLAKTPIVMLWSSFMAFDEGKYQASGADDKLEKPFEVAGLRTLINKYVPKTTSNPISKHLEFPKLDFDLSSGAVSQAKNDFGEVTPGSQPTAKEWNMAAFEDISQFAQNETSQMSSTNEASWATDSEWVRKDLGKFKVNIPEEEGDEAPNFDYPTQEIKNTNFLFKPGDAPVPAATSPSITKTKIEDILPPPPSPKAAVKVEKIAEPEKAKPALGPEVEAALTTALTEEMRDQVREVIEKVIWKVVPEIATTIIREEIKKIIEEEK